MLQAKFKLEYNLNFDAIFFIAVSCIVTRQKKLKLTIRSEKKIGPTTFCVTRHFVYLSLTYLFNV